MITETQLNELEKGQKIEYACFTNIYFDYYDNNHVVMYDKYGNKKSVYKDLFLKYASKGQ